jgi:hypothetical protein
MAKKAKVKEASVEHEQEAGDEHVILVRDDVDALGNPVAPTRAHVHISNVQGYLDADVGWRKE